VAEREPASVPFLFDRRPTTNGWRVAVVVIAFIAAVAALWAAKAFLIPLVLAALVSIGLEPFHRRLVQWRVPRALSAGVLVTGLVAALVGGGWALQAQAMTFINQLPTLTQQIREQFLDRQGALSGTVQPVQRAAEELQRAADASTTPSPPQKGAPAVSRVQLVEPVLRPSDLMWRGTMGAVAFIGETTVVLFLAYYLLANGHRYRQKMVAIAGPSLRRRRVAVDVINRITLQVERFLIARVVLSVFVAIGTASALAALDMSQALIWGLIAGLLSNIPYVGPIAACCAITLTAFVQFGDVEGAAKVGGAASLIVLFEGYVLTPWLMGKAGAMNTGAIFVSLMFWGWIWGVWGMLFAVPIMMAVKAVCDHSEALSPVSELLGE
jgi:predicted PurR-regulated permease PerM